MRQQIIELKKQLRRRATAELPEDPSRNPTPDGSSSAERRASASEWVARYRERGASKSVVLAHLTGLATVDPQAHLALLLLIKTAEDRDEIDDILSAFPGPGTGAWDSEVAEEILKAARSMVQSDPSPFRRAAAAEILFVHESPGKKQYQWALGALRAETEPMVRSALISEIGRHCFRLELTDEEVRPFLELMKRAVTDGIHCVNSLAHWSGRDEDFALLVALVDQEADPDRLVDLLSAFRAGVRLTKGREARSCEALLRVAGNPVTHRKARRRALQLLESHKPWESDTAAAVRRFRAETDSE